MTIGRRLGLAASSLSLSLLMAPAQASPTVTIEVEGIKYDVSYFQGSHDSSTAYFATPANSGLMPWWGNEAMATSFSYTLGYQLGKPNTSYSSNDTGPHFAYKLHYDEAYSQVQIKAYLDGDHGWGADPSETTFYATATLSPTLSAVPAPLPVFGAAATFGLSRRLRRRIRLGS